MAMMQSTTGKRGRPLLSSRGMDTIGQADGPNDKWRIARVVLSRPNSTNQPKYGAGMYDWLDSTKNIARCALERVKWG